MVYRPINKKNGFVAADRLRSTTCVCYTVVRVTESCEISVVRAR